MDPLQSQTKVKILVILTVVSGAVSLGIYFSNQENPAGYFGFIITVILAAAAMSAHISASSWNSPEISVRLSENAKEIVVRNSGNASAVMIHVSLVPLNIEFSPPDLEPDAEFRYQLKEMLPEAKAVVLYESHSGSRYQKSSILSATGPDEDDILKPMFPMFRWKSGP